MSDTAIHLDVRSRPEGSVYETGPSTFLCAPLRDVPYTFSGAFRVIHFWRPK
jgi:hypothetical protein